MVTQWKSVCLECARPWVLYPALEKNAVSEIMKKNSKTTWAVE